MIDLVLPYVDHESPWVRYQLTNVLSYCESLDSRSAAALIRLATDEDADVRFLAVFERGVWWEETGEPELRHALERAVDDADETVARTAREALTAE